MPVREMQGSPLPFCPFVETRAVEQELTADSRQPILTAYRSGRGSGLRRTRRSHNDSAQILGPRITPGLSHGGKRVRNKDRNSLQMYPRELPSGNRIERGCTPRLPNSRARRCGVNFSQGDAGVACNGVAAHRAQTVARPRGAQAREIIPDPALPVQTVYNAHRFPGLPKNES